MSKKNLKKCFPNLEWEEDEILSKNGSIESVYYYKGVRAIKLPLESGVAIPMAGYTLIHHDLRMILCWLSIVKDEYKKTGIERVKQTAIRITPENLRDKFDVIKAFMVASFTFYGKLFTKAEGRKIKLDVSIFENDSDMLKTHNEIMLYRHNFSAHSGKEKIEYVEVSLILDAVKERATRPFIVRTMNQPNAVTNKFLNDFIRNCEFILGKIDVKLTQLNGNYYKYLTENRLEMIYNITKM